MDDAIFFIDHALDACGEELSSKASFLKYEKGWFHYLKLEFEDSLVFFMDVLRDCLNYH